MYMFPLFSLVASHGFMIGLTDCNSGNILGRIRDYSDISTFIDNIRNPSGILCRNAVKTVPTNFSVQQDKICIGLAISNNAEHVGPCSLEFISVSGEVFNIGSYGQCVNSAKKGQCGNTNAIPELVTGDMCRYDLSFDLNGVNLPSGSGFFRWVWTARHVTPNEDYNNCVDVNISGARVPGVTSTTKINPTRVPQSKKVKRPRKKKLYDC